MSPHAPQVRNELMKLSFDIEKSSGLPEPVARLLSDHFLAAQSPALTQCSSYIVSYSIHNLGGHGSRTKGTRQLEQKPYQASRKLDL